MAGTSLKPLSTPEWESLIDDFNLGGCAGLHRWTGSGSFSLLYDLGITSLLRKDFPIHLKLNILTFLEHHSLDDNSASSSSSSSLHRRLIDALRSVIQSPADPFALKDQFLISTTSIFITVLVFENNNEDDDNLILIRDLVELLLIIINRPNHGLDRHTRGIACECLRQLELAFPCLLSEIIHHLWSLCQSERTHVSQCYVLLLSTTVLNVVKLKPSDTGITNATSPLIPFNVPQFLIGGVGAEFVWKEKEVYCKELKRVVAFLLECPQCLTPFGLMEFMVAMLPVAEELELHASLLRVQFSWLLHTFEPLLCHAYLGMCLKFLDYFQGKEFEVASRVLLLSREPQLHLVFRLLGLHWMMGFFSLIVGEKAESRKRSILDMSLSIYPTIFDALAIKALKLDLLAYCSHLICNHPRDTNGSRGNEAVCGVKLFEDGLVSVSTFKWLPPWSTETAVAFRTFHKFLIGGSPHNASSSSSSTDATLIESNLFYTLQKMLVDSTSEFKGLVPVIIACIDRLLGCDKHHWLGEHLLKTLDKHLLPKLETDYSLGYYFPIFERISENIRVSPSGLLNLLTRFVIFLVKKHGPDTGLKSWHHGSEILGICRTLLIHHPGSSLFTGLSHLLTCASLYFPDLEVRDNARFYLRMLICVPGKKLKYILNTSENLLGISPSNSASFFSFQSPRVLSDRNKSSSIASYIHIERVTPLLVKQSWSLSLPNFGVNLEKPGFFEGITDNEPEASSVEIETVYNTEMLHQQNEPLRVLDAKNSEIVRVLRRHFAIIPDYRHMPGIKIKICCSLRFNSEIYNGIMEVNTKSEAAINLSDEVDNLPTLYATVLNFASSAPYGRISPFQIPFLLGSSRKIVGRSDFSLAIVPVENGNRVKDENYSTDSPVCIELEPREPMPGLVDVFVETNADNGQIIRGQLHTISVGIEDMFLRANLPDDIAEDDPPGYYANLFDALWEACETSSSSIGRETFVLKGGKGVAAISGTRSVKLVEVPVTSLVRAVECHLAPFVVCVMGRPLVDMVKAGGVIRDVLYKDFGSDSSLDVTSSPTRFSGPLYIDYFDDEEKEDVDQFPTSRENIGCFQILIFLPPRFHLLFQMEVHDFSTLIRIRTDHWPCLAYVDDYLEALFLG